jgi:flagellar biosynthetic protein FlhB
MADDDQLRNEQPTPYKLEQARKRGCVPRGQDLNSFLALLVLLAVLYFAGAHLVKRSVHLAGAALSMDFGRLAQTDPLALPIQLFGSHLRLWGGLLVLLMVCGALACLFQTGPVFSFTPIKPDLKRLNFVEGFKRFFNLKLVFDTLRAMFKALLLALAVYWFIQHVMPTLLSLHNGDVRQLTPTLLKLIIQLLGLCLLLLVPVVVLDIVVSRRDYHKRMRMSRRDMTEEHKQREGDPRIRARQKALQKEARQRSASLRRVKEADVLITNPTRLAIALRYDGRSMDAPLVLAKGAGQLARLMREMAWRHHVPVVQNRALARQLFRHAGLEQPIPGICFAAVARILVWLHARRGPTQNERSTRWNGNAI